MSELIQQALTTFEKSLDRRLLASLEVCARCGICAESCHVFAAEPEFRNAPAAKAEAVRRFYRRLHDPIGRLFHGGWGRRISGRPIWRSWRRSPLAHAPCAAAAR